MIKMTNKNYNTKTLDVSSIIKKYQQYEKNTINNIIHELHKIKEYDTPYYDDATKKKVKYHSGRMIQYYKGQLSIIREIVSELNGSLDAFYHKSIDYQLGDVVEKW